MRGKFIAFEGGEGTGKSTQARLLSDHIEKNGKQCVLTREPGGTVGAEAIRALLLDPPGSGWGARAEALLFAAARSDHVEKLINPALTEGKWVICDRYLDSSRAYQGGAGSVGDEAVLTLHEIGSKGLRPDLTLLVTVPADLINQRLTARDAGQSDAIGGRNAAYHQAVADTFIKLAKREPENFVLIDGVGSVDQVSMRILQAVTDRFGAEL
ncbi:dTMP kinase [Pontixanthobacter gangjinensis]